MAISVVFAHTYGFVFVGGRLAVQLFYMISGFLISFVLTELKTYRSVKTFYVNRFLRLFPIYWVVASISLVFVLCSSLILGGDPHLLKAFRSVDLAARVSLIISNIILFGQDWIMFTGIRDGSFQFVSNFYESEVVVATGLLVPQAWTLGVELTFYLIAPFVLRRLRLMIALLFASMLVRAYLMYTGLGFVDPWSYRFFPAELSLFLLGSLSHQLWRPYLMHRGLLSSNASTMVVLVIFAYCTVYFLLPGVWTNSYILMVLFVFALPFLFDFQRRNKWDGVIAELSYPIYISHMLVVSTTNNVLQKFFDSGVKSGIGTSIVLVVTIIFSIVLNVTIGKAVEKFRFLVKVRQ